MSAPNLTASLHGLYERYDVNANNLEQSLKTMSITDLMSLNDAVASLAWQIPFRPETKAFDEIKFSAKLIAQITDNRLDDIAADNFYS